jgi:arylsulfatase A-like enzyme
MLSVRIAGSIALLAAMPQETPAPKPRPRSVLFYLIDTCRADHLSANGYARATTPYLEELAARGVRFTHCFSQAPWTKPSVSAILTSCYPTVTGMTSLLDQLDSRFVTMPEALRDAGWYTAGFSANPLMGRLSNYNQGFRKFVDAALVIPGGDCIKYASGSAKALNRLVLPWIDETTAWPFFLYVHSVDPHEDYQPAPEYLKLFADPAREPEFRREWQALIDAKDLKIGNYCTKADFEKAGVAIDPFVAYGRDLYDADIRANDDEIARLLDTLRERGDLDDMIVVVTADHGEEFMEHGGTSHAFMLWNELIHVPLLVVAPGLLPEGLVVDEPVQSLDLYPTLLDLLGVAAPEGLQGTSFAPLLHGESGSARPIFSENHEVPGTEPFFQPQGVTLSLIEGPWKLILNVKSPANRERPRRELYRLDTDFAERNDLAAEQAELADRMETKLLEWWARNQARRKGVDVKSLTVEELREADPDTLERLRKLGYVR